MKHRSAQCLYLWRIVGTLIVSLHWRRSNAFSTVSINNNDNNIASNNRNNRQCSYHHPTQYQHFATRKFYEYEGMQCSYELSSSNHATTNQSTIKVLLIHPVGIGLCSWFWDKLILSNEKQSSSTSLNANMELYAINLIGCGQSRDNAIVPDAYFLNKDTNQESPWLTQCDHFLHNVMNVDDGRCVVVSQGGLAPIAIQLAARNPHTISHVILASPPTPQQLRDTLDAAEARKNWKSLRNLPNFAFSLLETKSAIRFFSNLFLFRNPCDDKWLYETLHECDPSVRPAVCYFNAGMCEVPSLQTMMENMTSSRVLILRGDSDKRKESFQSDMTPDCRLAVITNATNVIPWEASEAFFDSVTDFLSQETTPRLHG